MTQTTNRFFDEIARLMNDAAGVASGVRREFETMVRSQADRVLRDLDVVKREEFEAVKEMARLGARGERGPEGAHRRAGGQTRPRRHLITVCEDGIFQRRAGRSGIPCFSATGPL